MIRYQPLYVPTRKRLRLQGHAWYCDRCGELVHSDPRLDVDETVEQQADRVARIKEAIESHVCPRKKETA